MRKYLWYGAGILSLIASPAVAQASLTCPERIHWGQLEAYFCWMRDRLGFSGH